MYAHTYLCPHAHTFHAQMHAHTQMHACTHTHTHTHTHTRRMKKELKILPELS